MWEITEPNLHGDWMAGAGGHVGSKALWEVDYLVA